ncbi:MAG: ribonuclease P protein component [Fimbriimonadales bacterium]
MIPKERRFAKQDFDRVFDTGRGLRRGGVRIMWAAGSGKAAVVVAKSVGSTAYRNTIKRRWREALGAAEKAEALPPEMDVVFVVGTEAVELRGSAIVEQIGVMLAETRA